MIRRQMPPPLFEAGSRGLWRCGDRGAAVDVEGAWRHPRRLASEREDENTLPPAEPRLIEEELS